MLSAVLILIFLACGIIAWRRRNTNSNEPPSLNGALPLIGHGHLLIGATNIHIWIYLKEFSYECLNAGGVMSTYLGPRTFYYVTDPDDFLKISDTCLEKDTCYKFAKPWLGNGLVTCNSTVWKDHRRLLDSAFSQNVLDGYLDVFNAQACRLVKELEVEVNKGPFDHLAYNRKNALETMCLTLLGVDFSDKSVRIQEYVHAMNQMFNILQERLRKPWLHNDFIYSWSALRRKQDECLKTLRQVSYAILKKKQADYSKNGKYKNIEDKANGSKLKTFIDILLELATFNDEEIREHIDTMMFASHDTIATVLTYAMLLVGSYPDVQKKIFEELHNIFGDDDRDVMKQDLSQMVYLEAVIKESMRIYPIIPVNTRYLDRDVKLKNCTLTKGRTCFLYNIGIHRHPMWGLDAEKFKPERWLDPASLSACSNAFAGFGVGRRSCIGKSYALMSMKTTLAHVFRQYRVSGNNTDIVSKIDVTLKPVSGHHVTIELRK